jgi:hypothetical protein
MLFSNNSLPNLKKIYLSSNLLNDAIADELIKMNFSSITLIDLRGNEFNNPVKMMDQLKSKYKNA